LLWLACLFPVAPVVRHRGSTYRRSHRPRSGMHVQRREKTVDQPIRLLFNPRGGRPFSMPLLRYCVGLDISGRRAVRIHYRFAFR
jgi:hypothetical protein